MTPTPRLLVLPACFDADLAHCLKLFTLDCAKALLCLAGLTQHASCQ